MENLSEETVLSHIKSCELEEIIHAVLKLDTVLSCALGSIDKLPDLFKSRSCGNFYSRMLSVLHSVKCNRSMVHPVCNDVYKIDIFPLAKLLIGIRRSAIGISFRKARPSEIFLCMLNSFRTNVADSHNLNSRNLNKSADRIRSSTAKTHETHTNCIERFCRKSQNVFLTCRTLWDINFNNSSV